MAVGSPRVTKYTAELESLLRVLWLTWHSCPNCVVSVGTGDKRQDALGRWGNSPSTVRLGRVGWGVGRRLLEQNLEVQK